MEVILNTESLRPPLTGIGRYTQHLLTGLARREEIERIHCFTEREWVAHSAEADGLAGTIADGGGGKLKRKLVRWARSVPGIYEARFCLNSMILRMRAPHFGQVVYHEPNFVLKPIDVPAVVTCHDLSFIFYPEHHPRERVRHLERHLGPSLERAGRVVTDSQYVRREVIERFGLPPSKVVAIPLGVDPIFRPRGRQECVEALGRLGLDYRGYVLAVATVEPRKNLSGLLDAYGKLPILLQRRWPLVVAGASGWGYTDLEERMRALQRAGSLRRLGYVAEDDLAALYAGARFFAYPSIYEGFGLPPLEAMASGVPVMASDASSLPEVVGDAGLLVNPFDVDEMAEALKRLMEDEDLGARLRRDGPERATLFTWEACVARTVAIYNELAA